MAMLLACPSCSRPLQMHEATRDQKVRCPICGHVFIGSEALEPATVAATPLPSVLDSPPPPLEVPEPPQPSNTAEVPPPSPNGDDEEREEWDWQRQRGLRRDCEPHRGGTILVFGIVGLVMGALGLSLCGFPAIV